MPKSSVYPSLERKLGGPDNWIERVGGLPQYIERIAKHLHYEKGMTISHAIATAVNTVKRWARKGTVVKYNDPKNNHVTVITAAQAAKDVAEWEAKKARARAGAGGRSRGRLSSRSVRLSEAVVDVQALADRANAIADPTMRGQARMQVLDLAFAAGGPDTATRHRLASRGQALPDGSFPIDDVAQLKKAIKAYGRAKNKAAAKRHIIKRARALGATNLLPDGWIGKVDLANLTKDGRKSYKKQGKWKHGFVPVDESAKTSKAKGSPIAKRRINRLYSGNKAEIASKEAVKRTLALRRAKATGGGGGATQLRSTTGRKGGKQQERVQRAALSRYADIRDTRASQRHKLMTKMEIGKGQRSDPRATQPWNQIAADQKVTRNGKRYVVTVYRGRHMLTEWFGNNAPVETPGKGDRQYRTLTEGTLKGMTTGELRKLLRSGKNSKDVRTKIRKILQQKQRQNRKRA